MATTTLGVLSSPAEHAMVLGAMKSSVVPSSSSSSCRCSSLSLQFQPRRIAIFTPRRTRAIACEVAIKSDGAATSSEEESPPSSSSSPVVEAVDETGGARIGARVRVTVPLKVYHVAKAPEIELTGMEGTLKQYVGVWKGKRISANFPFKVEFVTEVEGRGAVKFFAHLRDDEFEYV